MGAAPLPKVFVPCGYLLRNFFYLKNFRVKKAPRARSGALKK